MKNISLLLAVTLFSIPAFAAKPAAKKLPDNLICSSDSSNAIAKKFHIYGMNTEDARTNIDARVDGRIEESGGLVMFDANNGCDNNYSFIFYAADLEQLAAGKLKSVKGLMNFYNADTECKDENCELLWETATLTCRVLTVYLPRSK